MEKNIDSAIHHFSNALQIYTKKDFPEQWALVQNNLGTVYLDFSQGEQAEHLETAIHYFSKALEIFTYQSFPEQWARGKNNLGNAYSYRVLGKPKENIETAIRYYLEALNVYTRESYLQSHAETQLNLGIAYYRCGEKEQFSKAYDVFTIAIGAVESLRSEILSGNDAKQKLAEKWNNLYQIMVDVCLILDNPTDAIKYIERSKTRNLVELILSRDLHSIFPPEVVKQLEQLRDEIASGQYQLQTATAENPTALAKHLEQLRQQRNELQDHYLPIGSGFQFAPFQATLDEHTAIVEFYMTNEHIMTFIVTRQTQKPIVWQSEIQNLVDWANAYLNDLENDSTQKKEWQKRLTYRLQQLAKILDVEKILKTLSELSTEYEQLILIPHRYLHLFPLNALPVAEQKYFLDYFHKIIYYKESIHLLQLAQKRERPNLSNFFAIQNPNPEDNLSYADLEVEVIRSFFSIVQVLNKQTATKATLTDNQDLSSVHCSHFSCHGTFNLEFPLESALLLANEERLTLAEIFGLSLNQCRLVTLSACETGLTDPTSISDEYIGLPSGFLYAGCTNVVSSLWTVNQVSTAFLMIKFYQNLKENQSSVAKALNNAQRWLRDATQQQLLEWATQLNLDKNKMTQIEDELDWYDSDEKPFNSPYHWAAFCAIGQ
jgi:CHAT domain-containing protein